MLKKAIHLVLLCAVLAMPGCTKTDRSEEAQKLSEELINTAISNLDKTLERIDSAEEAGVLTAILANTVKACIYENASRHRMAAYYAEKAIAAEEDYIVTTSADSSNYCKARWILGNGAYANGEYGKAFSLAKGLAT
jgi:hypothetical protein